MGEHQFVNVYNLIIVSLSSEEKQQQSFPPAAIYGEKMEERHKTNNSDCYWVMEL